MSNTKKIGLIAGNRRLPFQFVDWTKKNGYDLYILGVKGEVDEKLKDEVSADKYLEFYISEIAKCKKFFKGNGVNEIVMIGGIAKAKIKLNFDVIKVAFRLLFMKNKHKGIFTIIMSIFAKNGITVRSIQEFMTDLIIGQGSLGKISPSKDDLAAFTKNLDTIIEYTKTGEGQAVVIYKGEILAYENFKGTDDLMRRAAEIRSKKGGECGGIMAKIMEPGQDERVDLPVVGTGTVETIAKYGLDGIFVEAGRAITDGTAETMELADKKGVFVYGVKI